MAKVDADVERIVYAALAGERPSRQDLLLLYGLAPYSLEAYYVHWAARELSWRATHGVAHVLAQIGIDAHPCPSDCSFCAFSLGVAAARGKSGEAADGAANAVVELSLDEIVAYARAYDAAGANLISLMSTDAYGFERYVQVVAAVRQAVSPEMPIMVNTCDFDDAGARALKAAGATTVYHALRIGEGSITKSTPERRLATIAFVKAVGMPLSTGVGPVWEGCGVEEVVDQILLVRDMRPKLAGVCRLTRVPGTPLANAKVPNRAEERLLNAIFRLAVGTSVAYEYQNVSWLDAGTDPRGHKFASIDAIAADVAKAKKMHEDLGWATTGPTMEFWLDADDDTAAEVSA